MTSLSRRSERSVATAGGSPPSLPPSETLGDRRNVPEPGASSVGAPAPKPPGEGRLGGPSVEIDAAAAFAQQPGAVVPRVDDHRGPRHVAYGRVHDPDAVGGCIRPRVDEHHVARVDVALRELRHGHTGRAHEFELTVHEVLHGEHEARRRVVHVDRGQVARVEHHPCAGREGEGVADEDRRIVHRRNGHRNVGRRGLRAARTPGAEIVGHELHIGRAIVVGRSREHQGGKCRIHVCERSREGKRGIVHAVAGQEGESAGAGERDRAVRHGHRQAYGAGSGVDVGHRHRVAVPDRKDQAGVLRYGLARRARSTPARR